MLNPSPFSLMPVSIKLLLYVKMTFHFKDFFVHFAQNTLKFNVASIHQGSSNNIWIDTAILSFTLKFSF